MRSVFFIAAIVGLAGLGGCGGKQTRAVTADGTGSGAATVRAKLTPKDIYQQTTGSIVRIDVADAGHGGRVGTGFVVDKSGLIATNLHVVVGSDKIKVKLGDNKEYDVQDVAGYDPDRDLALIRIKPTTLLTAIRLGDSDQLIPGDQVVAIGNPLGFDNTVSEGLVSAVRVLCTPTQAAASQCPDSHNNDFKYLQISVPISQGSSGGPLFNQYGEVIAVTTAIVTQGQSINLAVPTNYLKLLIARPATISLDKFASDTQKLAEQEGEGGGGDEDEPHAPIVRIDPHLTEKVFDGCKINDIQQLVGDISQAIESGAPLYNTRSKRGYEACFRIYEGTSLHWQTSSACKGVSAAFKDGLSRAGTLATYNEKAWALRDTFDGLIGAAKMWAIQHPQP